MDFPPENARVKQIIDFYCKGNVNKFSREINISQPRISRLFSIDPRNNRYPLVSFEIVQSIINKFININSEWLLTGKGPILKEDINVQKRQTAPERNIHLIPLYDTLIATGKTSTAISPATEPAEYIDAGDWFRDATAAMRVHGDSMYPEYHSGSIVALKEVSKSIIVYGQDYVLETDDHCLLKRLQRGRDSRHILLTSANTEKWENGNEKGRLIHEPFDVHIDDVRRLFIVLGAVRRNHSSLIIYNNKNSG